ncbi:hypothetical protein F511_45999 [Dorcoceras hygrometricum]|uniref:Uncharacterized protein n=1 Tax=Dorcoceras hygrometricum TaxID=472368 RepID=A0A2Z6ZUL7_9LAMI|nr:hypothetical protein F511_45999 [Dorcoceras hygrometricum]
MVRTTLPNSDVRRAPHVATRVPMAHLTSNLDSPSMDHLYPSLGRLRPTLKPLRTASTEASDLRVTDVEDGRSGPDRLWITKNFEIFEALRGVWDVFLGKGGSGGYG